MIQIQVPATTANLGPAFDSMGMALSLYNYFEFYESDEEKNYSQDNMIFQAANILYQQLGRDISHLRFKVRSEVPRSRGLGSSATCIVGGLMGANALLSYPFTKEQILSFATQMEGHPDNVAPALYGSCVSSFMEKGQVKFTILEGLDSLRPYVAIPEFPLETSRAREALPKNLPFFDAVYNISRIPFLVEGLRTSNIDLLIYGCQDKIHEPYRKRLIHGYDEMKKIEDKVKGKMLISGAGPSLLFLTSAEYKKEDVLDLWQDLAKETKFYWEIKDLFIDRKGALEL